MCLKFETDQEGNTGEEMGIFIEDFIEYKERDKHSWGGKKDCTFSL